VSGAPRPLVAAVMQPYLLPYVGYFQLVRLADEFVLHDDVQYIKGGWINRNRMLVNGASAWFTLSVRHADHALPICERQWHDAKRESQALLRRFDAAYRRAPHCAEVMPIIRAALAFPSDNVADSLAHCLGVVCHHLGLTTHVRSSRTLGLGPALAGQDRVLEICARLGATAYVNLPGGVDLYDPAAFGVRGLKLNFIQPALAPYPQLGAAFVAGLSIVDVLMFNSRDRVREMLADYTLT
jgi:hypothetical protein